MFVIGSFSSSRLSWREEEVEGNCLMPDRLHFLR